MHTLKEPVIHGIHSPFNDLRPTSWKVDDTSSSLTDISIFEDEEYRITLQRRDGFNDTSIVATFYNTLDQFKNMPPEAWNGMVVKIKLCTHNVYQSPSKRMLIPIATPQIQQKIGAWPVFEPVCDEETRKHVVLNILDTSIGPTAQKRMDYFFAWLACQQKKETASLINIGEQEELSPIVREWLYRIRILNTHDSSKFNYTGTPSFQSHHDRLHQESVMEKIAEELDLNLKAPLHEHHAIRLALLQFIE